MRTYVFCKKKRSATTRQPAPRPLSAATGHTLAAGGHSLTPMALAREFSKSFKSKLSCKKRINKQKIHPKGARHIHGSAPGSRNRMLHSTAAIIVRSVSHGYRRQRDAHTPFMPPFKSVGFRWFRVIPLDKPGMAPRNCIRVFRPS